MRLAAARGKANITVDFKNMPKGVRPEYFAEPGIALEVNTGYAMQGAQ